MTQLLRLLLMAYAFFLPVQIPFGASRLAPSDLFILLYAFFGLARLRLVRQTWSIMHWMLLGLFLIGTIHVALSSGTLTGYVIVNKDVGMIVLFLSYIVLTSAATTWKDVENVLRVFIVATALHSAASAAGLILIKVTGSHALSFLVYLDTRAAGMLVDPNAFGGLLMTALCIQAATYWSKRPILKGIPGLLAIVILGVGLLLTLSRSAWIGFALAALLGLFFRPKLATAYLTTAVLVGILLVAVVGSGGLGNIMSVANRPGTTQNRLDQITQALPLIAAEPILGTGIGVFIEKNGWMIHDTTVWMTTEFGFVGLTVFGCLILWYFRKGFAAFRQAPADRDSLVLGLTCAHLGMLGVSFGIEAFYQRHWWLVMAYIASCYHLLNSRESIPVYSAYWTEPIRTTSNSEIAGV